MRKTIPGCALLLLGIAVATSAHAQWKWRDASGTVHYSDQPPPLSVPAASIESMRGGAPRSAAAAAPAADAPRDASATAAAPVTGGAAAVKAKATDAAPVAAPAAAPGGDAAPARPRTAADRLNELRKQQAEKEAALRKQREQEQLEARAGQWCDDLRARARILETGRRVAQIDSTGEQSFLTDEDREAQLAALRRDLQAQCKTGG